ncbi:MAG: hypothetical protein E7043_03095 [Lentisphaerae bacterium]|nr:hypothetical protein [Lentisphaerota bacterium]MBE6389140.1 hypothetical protein [Lentisphaerota bacterium]
MKLCAVQIPFADTPENAVKSVDAAVALLQQCDADTDIILLPEYSNAPGRIPAEMLKDFADAQSSRLIPCVIETARRCQAITAVNFLAEVAPGEYRNITRIFDRQGNCAGEFHKQHLPVAEKNLGVSYGYTYDFRPPEIVEIDGIRFGFLICYDTYFTEYIAHLAYRKPDVVLVSSFQRAERHDVLRFMNRNLAFNCNSFVLRASVSMGSQAVVGGQSMVVDPEGQILAEFGSKVGIMSCEVPDIHYKYMRSNSFGGKLIPNDLFVTQGRTPWCYRPAGSMTIPGEKELPYPRICAHRGFSTVAPENSMAAFGAAVALGAEEIELDIRFTKDHIPVSVHDERLEKVSNGSGAVSDFTLEELRKLDFGSCFSEKFAGLQIITLEEVLAKFSCHTILNMHIKSAGKTFPREYMQKIVELLWKYDSAGHVYFMATPEILTVAEEIAPEIPRCMSADAGKWDIVDNAISCNCQKVQFFYPYCNKEMIDKAHAHGIKCNCFYCDDPAGAVELLQHGIDTILTNNYLPVALAAGKLKNKKGK